MLELAEYQTADDAEYDSWLLLAPLEAPGAAEAALEAPGAAEAALVDEAEMEVVVGA